MAKRIFSLTLSVVVFLSLASCSLTSYERRYPSYFTGEYVKEHYELVDMNLVYLESYRKCTSSISQNGRYCQFMKIKDVPLEQFVGMKFTRFLSSECRVQVLFNSEFPSNPIKDFEIEKIELYAKEEYSGLVHSDFENYGKIIYIKQIYEFDNSEVMREVLESIRNMDRENIENTAPPQGGYGMITVRIHFKEYKNIVWDAEVRKNDEKYYLRIILVNEKQKIFSGNSDYAYVYVGPNFDALMESLFNR